MYRAMALSSVVLSSCVAAAWAADKPKPPAELVRVRADFAAAVSAKKEDGAAALTSFPFKQTVFHAPPKLTRRQFSKLFAEYTEMADCIRTAPLDYGHDGWVIECDGNIFHFGLRDGHWRHTAYENINE